MPSKPPVIFPQEQRLLTAFGERLRLARLRRKWTTVTVSKRAGISRTTLYNAESGDPAVTLGTYLRVLAVLSLEGDFNALAADDKVGRKLQDLGLPQPRPRKARVPRTQRAPRPGKAGSQPSDPARASEPRGAVATVAGEQDVPGTLE